MSLLQLLGMDEDGSNSSASSVPETVSLDSDNTPSDSELSDLDDDPKYRNDRRSVARKKKAHAGHQYIVEKGNQQESQLRTSCQSFDLVDSCDSFCFGMEAKPFSLGEFQQPSDIWSSFEGKQSPDYVTVAIEATAITCLESEIPRQALCGDNVLPLSVGSTFVGMVQECGPEADDLGIRPGFRVASIVRSGAISKFVTVPVLSLSIIPKQLDAADVAALISFYLPGFQALHHGRPKSFRYRRDCLKGKNVLVTGGATLEGQAILQLARWSGATVHVTAPLHHMLILKKLCAVTVLEDDPRVWFPALQQKMDVVVDTDFPRNFHSIRKLMAPKGRLVCLNPRRSYEESSGWVAGLEAFLERYQLSLVKRASIFDYDEYLTMCPDEVRFDMNFLLKLLATRQIRPRIDRYIKLKDVPRVLKELQSNPLSGAIICEPWNE